MSSLTPKTLGLGLAGPQFLPDDRTPLGASTEVHDELGEHDVPPGQRGALAGPVISPASGP